VPTVLLSNGVDTESFGPDLRSDEARAELRGDSGASCVAVYAGLHGIAQGLDQVLDAAARLQDLTHLVITFVGDGPEKERLVAQARQRRLERVRFLPPRPREAMPVLMASADIALVPLGTSLPGAVPSKLYEAMGSGLPVVLAAEGEATKIVRETGSGVAVRPGDSEGLAQALRQLANDSARRQALGRNGRAAVIAQFDRRRIADQFITHLEGLLRCSSAPSSVPAPTS
jgi:glycosyltransferase involved in cell wall biosynthesis